VSGYGGLESILKVPKEEIKSVDWSGASLSFGSPIQIRAGSPKPIIFENNENLQDHSALSILQKDKKRGKASQEGVHRKVRWTERPSGLSWVTR